MTSAHRPTWAPAKGGDEQGGMRIFAPSRQVSVKNLPSQTELKFRRPGQASAKELLQRDLKAELEARELEASRKNAAETFEAERERDLLLLGGAAVEGLVGRKGGGPEGKRQDIGGGGGAARGGGGEAREGPGPGSTSASPPALRGGGLAVDPADAESDGSDGESGGEGASPSSSESDDDDDDEAELMAELARIRAERAAEAARQEAAEASVRAEEDRQRHLAGNPLLEGRLVPAAGTSSRGSGSSGGGIKRRWDDDVVFRNQGRSEPRQTKRFINDTIRNDFHRRFLDRYMK